MSDIEDIGVDDDLLFGFLDESRELLGEVDAALVELESNPTDQDIINAIFRPVHSIKGNAPFFGYTKLRNLAHELETILAQVRDGTRRVDKSLTTLLLEGIDEIRAILDRASNNQPELIDEQKFNQLLQKVVDFQSDTAGDQKEAWSKVKKLMATLSEYISSGEEEAVTSYRELKELLEVLAPSGEEEDVEAYPAPLKKLRDVVVAGIEKPEDESLVELVEKSLVEIEEAAQGQDAESLASKLQEDVGPFIVSIGFDQLLLETVDKAIADFMELKNPFGEEPVAESAEASSSETVSEPEQETSKQKTGKESESRRQESHKSMRVSEEHIDTFLSYVGELFIFGEMLSYLERRVTGTLGSNEIEFEFHRLIESFSILSHNLKKSLMSVRKVAVKSTLQKAPRLVRDIASARGKDIQVHIEGEDVEVDKSLIELIDAPLTHMVRNAADHGIETPEKRVENGKSEAGNISISVREEDKFIVLTVTDDGAGLNYDAIRGKAESLNIIRPGEKLSKDQLVDLLFQAGVSTAEKVTDVSGRGVGMDVVKKAIEQNGGSIQVESTAGNGTTFQVHLMKSVTTDIVEGFVFRVEDRFFVLPIDRVREVFSCDPVDIFSATGSDRYVCRNDKILPIVPAYSILSLDAERKDKCDAQHVLTVKACKRDMALLVDEVVAVQQVVHKGISHLSVDGDVFTGGALIGDGQIALILDADKFCDGYDVNNLANRAKVITRDENGNQSNSDGIEKTGELQSLVLVEIDGGRSAAIPLADVHRLEKITGESLELSNGRPAVQYRETIMPLFPVTKQSLEELQKREMLQVVVSECDGKPVGIVVDSILDIVEDRVDTQKIGDEAPHITGTAIISDRATDILSLSGLIEHNRTISASRLRV